jgi:nucleotide-binding universal stress UspA family protein
MSLKILLATDGSQNAMDAASLVSHMSVAQDVEVIVMTVIQMPEVGGMVAVESWLPELMEREKEQAAEVYESTRKLFQGTAAKVRGIVREGLVGQQVVSEANESRVDLVVVGAKGHSTVDRILLGSTSDYVATHCETSVLVVRSTGLTENPDRPIRVSVGFDDSQSSLAAIEQVNQFRMDREMHLDVLTVCQVVRTFRQDLLPNVLETRARLRERFKQLADDGVKALSHVTPHIQPHVLEAEHVGTAITDFAEHHHSDFLVVGDTERGMLGRLFLGSVSRFVLRHAACSVWIARHPG